MSHAPLRMIQSLTLKREQIKYKDRIEELSSYRNLVLWMVRLVHADPMLLLTVSLNCLKIRIRKTKNAWQVRYILYYLF